MRAGKGGRPAGVSVPGTETLEPLGGGGVCSQRAEVTPTSPVVSAHPAPPPPERRANRLAFGIYCAEAGIATTAAGSWAAAGLSGLLRATVWTGVTAVLAVGAIWLAEPAVTALSRCLQVGRTGRPADHH